ncbi:hypothetical protein ACOJBM_42445 [Rhizobium beringeri]
MAPIFLVDLDDTLFRSRRKLPGFTDGQLTLGARVLDPDAPASKYSYMTPTQKALVDWLLRTTQVIPVTARGTDSYANVQIPFSSYAIVANGAVILDPDGKPDAEWRDMVEAQLLPFADYFSELLDAARAKSADLGFPCAAGPCSRMAWRPTLFSRRTTAATDRVSRKSCLSSTGKAGSATTTATTWRSFHQSSQSVSRQTSCLTDFVLTNPTARSSASATAPATCHTCLYATGGGLRADRS